MLFNIAKVLVKAYLHIMYGLKVEGRENIDKNETYIIASNHRSLTDPPIVGVSAKGKVCFMAKAELFKNKLFGGLIRALGAFPVSRGKGDMTVITTAVENLNSGKSLIIFPEGTRSKDGKVGRGHSGAALIAAKTGKRIIPAGIVYDGKLKFRKKIKLVFGKPIDPADYCEICDEPNMRKLTDLKNAYMKEIKLIVEGEPKAIETEVSDNG